jgi:hypothetical protein
MNSTLPLICQNNLDKSGWWYPTIETPPGIYVEEYQGRCKLLTEAEFAYLKQFWTEMQHRGAWVRTGFEVGREYGTINIKANVFDLLAVHHPSIWKLEKLEGYRQWAVEFPSPTSKKYIRRAFFANTKHSVPDLDSKGRTKSGTRSMALQKKPSTAMIKRHNMLKAGQLKLLEL